MTWSWSARIRGACPACGHMPAWHDARGCTALVQRPAGYSPCPCARTAGDLTQNGLGGQ